jgi:methylglyoxal synthase
MKTVVQQLPANKTIALIAHDGRKSSLMKWCQKHRDELIKHSLIGTGTTGGKITQATGIPVQALISGPMGGDQQIGALIAEQKVHMVIFFWDPLEPMPHDPDVKALLRLAAVWNIPVACNETTADMLLASALFNTEMDWEIPDYNAYIAERK